MEKVANGKEIILLSDSDSESPMALFAMMELQSIATDKVYCRRGQPQTSPLLAAYLMSPSSMNSFTVLSLSQSKIIFETEDIKVESWQKLRTFLHTYVKGSHKKSDADQETLEKKLPDTTRAITKEEDIKRRRYTVYMSDLENAILYSLSHEVGSRNTIVGPSLTALQEYLNVLVTHFPGREETMDTLSKLRTWVVSHDDALRGEDLISELNDIRAATGSFADTPNGAWIGCKGSKPFHGGYPCSLWTLWHVLTVNQKFEEKPPSRVLDAMLGYVKHFFGCEDCVRHFQQTAEDGQAIQKEVKSKNSSILWLWRAHNKANVRLQNDITDDRQFPKAVFPDKEHCTDCYNNRLGTDLWSEFNHDKVLNFLHELYSEFNYQGLRHMRKQQQQHHESHQLVVFDDEQPVHKEYLSTSNSFWSPLDISLCFSIYLLSAAILIFVYFKFVAKKRFNVQRLLQRLRPKSNSSNIFNSV